MIAKYIYKTNVEAFWELTQVNGIIDESTNKCEWSESELHQRQKGIG